MDYEKEIEEISGRYEWDFGDDSKLSVLQFHILCLIARVLVEILAVLKSR